MMAPTVSIVVPTYQRAATVERLLRSLIDAPPTTSFEIVVVDNASTDGTNSIVSAAAEQLPSQQFHRWPENLTRLENWKHGIERASATGSRSSLGGTWAQSIAWSQCRRAPGNKLNCCALLDHDDHTVDYTMPPDCVVRSRLELPGALPAPSTAAIFTKADDSGLTRYTRSQRRSRSS